MAFLEIKNITQRFGGLIAVDNVEMSVEQGEIVSIIGPNGAGKTTVFNMITGVYSVTEGDIYFNGDRISRFSPRQIVKKGISRTFQNIRLFKNLRVIENALIGAHINMNYSLLDTIFRTPGFKRTERELHEKAVDVLCSIGLENYIDAYAGNLPYGLQRRLEIARIIMSNAKILLLDEPVAGMNPLESNEMMAFIKSLQGDGYTILLIEHDMNVVMNISERIYVMDHGKLIAHGKPDEIVQNPEVIKAYLGDISELIPEDGQYDA